MVVVAVVQVLPLFSDTSTLSVALRFITTVPLIVCDALLVMKSVELLPVSLLKLTEATPCEKFSPCEAAALVDPLAPVTVTLRGLIPGDSGANVPLAGVAVAVLMLHVPFAAVVVTKVAPPTLTVTKWPGEADPVTIGLLLVSDVGDLITGADGVTPEVSM